MRYVPTGCLREGLILGKTLYGRNNEPLLIAGVTLSSIYIDSIQRLKYPGVYVDDELSKDIEIMDVISDNLRITTTNSIKKAFIQAEYGKKLPIQDLTINVESIIEELLDNPNMMINMVDLKVFDNYTYAHSVNVAVLSLMMGITAGLKKETLVKLGLGAIMHDIGKIFIPKDILNKPSKLTPDEFTEISKHSQLGYDYVEKNYKLPEISLRAILDHHEKYDGTGYPMQLAGDKISFFGRIIAIADVYDALTSQRPYRPAMNPGDALEYIMAWNGIYFDNALVQYFVRNIAPYPIGSMVNLSNNWVGIVKENYKEMCMRPLVRIIRQKDIDVEPFEISLGGQREYLNVTVTGVIEM